MQNCVRKYGSSPPASAGGLVRAPRNRYRWRLGGSGGVSPLMKEQKVGRSPILTALVLWAEAYLSNYSGPTGMSSYDGYFLRIARARSFWASVR